MLNKLFFKFFVVMDQIETFLYTWGLKILLVIFALMIVHNVYKMSELSSRYTGEYKSLYEVYEDNNKFMNVYVAGGSGKTVVILPAFGSQAPNIQYKTLVESLRGDYKVAVVEYFGYGFSMGIKKERNNENIVNEIRIALQKAGVNGPYVFVAADTSSIYAMKYQTMYPGEVQGIVSLDGVYPKEINDPYLTKMRNEWISNINITSIFELSGFERIASWVTPKVFYIDLMKDMPNIYGDEEFKVYRNRIGSSYLTRTMVREINKLIDNEKEMSYYSYPDYLPVLEIISKDTMDKFQGYLSKDGGAKNDLKVIAESMITNSAIQSLVVIPGDKNIQLSNPIDTAAQIREFLVRF